MALQDLVYFGPVVHLFFHGLAAFFAELVEWILGMALDAHVFKVQQHLEVGIKLGVLGDAVGVYAPLVQLIEVYLFVFVGYVLYAWHHKSRVQCKSTNKLSILHIDDPEENVARKLETAVIRSRNQNTRLCVGSGVDGCLRREVVRSLHSILLELEVGVVGPNWRVIFTIVYFNAGFDHISRVLRNRLQLDQLESLAGRRLHFSLKRHLKVLNVTLLRWLRDTSAIAKPLVTIKDDRVQEVVGQARIQQKA